MKIINWIKGLIKRPKSIAYKSVEPASTEREKCISDIPLEFREALALHTVFMAFGIPENDIYVAYADKSFQVIAYQKQEILLDVRDGNKNKRLEFCVDVCKLTLDKEDFIKSWRDATTTYNAAPFEDRKAMLENTQANQKACLIVAHMLAKGFKSLPLDSLPETKKEIN